MVKHKQTVETSSKQRKSDYRFPSYIAPGYMVPEEMPHISVEPEGQSYVITGTLEEAVDDYPSQLPHLALANLRVDDAHAAGAFVKRYGPLADSQLDFTVTKSELVKAQDELRAAWNSNPAAVMTMENRVVENMEVDVLIDTTGEVQLRPRHMYTLIAFLFLRDFSTDKLAVCGNPDCPAPYFRKRRSTQKFCEAGSCAAFAQRQYSLAWWNRVGRKKRDKRIKLHRRRSAQ